MKRLLLCLAALFALALAAGAIAQTAEEDRGYLQAFLEDNLSGAGRQVRITGFEGALSSRATIDELTVADNTGVWITLRKITLDWNRSALLRGNLDITELSAEEIELPRAPQMGGGDVPSPEASGFALPDLPVSLKIGTLKVGKVALGEALFGAAAVISLQGSAELDGGAGKATLAIKRIDGTEGALTLAGTYANATRFLDLALELSEPENGIAANLIGLPGTPSVDLAIKGAGPLDDFAADITLATDETPRLTGKVTLKGGPSETEDGGPDFRAFSADLGGDIAPLFLPEYRAFFGPDIRLKLTGARHEDGRLNLDNLVLTTDALRLAGKLELGADYWPAAFALTGQIADQSGAPVLLPLPGAETRIAGARLKLEYDHAVGDSWRAEVAVQALERDEVSISQLRLTGSGSLQQGDGSAIGQLRGNATYAALAIAPSDPALAAAIGPRLTGGMQFAWTEGAPLLLSDLVVSGEDYGLSGRVTLKGLSDQLNLSAEGELTLTAKDLSRFAALSGLAVEGGAVLAAEGEIFPLSGIFFATAKGTGSELRIGQPRIDPLLNGESRLDLEVRRNEAGTTIERFDIANDHLGASITGTLSSERSALTLDARITDTARISGGLSGAATLAGTLRQTGADWAVDLQASGPGSARATTEGVVVTLAKGEIARISGRVDAAAETLAPYSELAGRRLSGAAQASVEGWLDPRNGAFEAALDANAQSLGFGVQIAEPLLRGNAALTGTLKRGPGGVVTADRVELVTPQGRALITGTVSEDRTVLDFDASLRDLGLIAPGVSGPATAEGSAELVGENWQVDLRGTGPGGTTAQVTGQVAGDARRADLALTGTAPLELVNSYISPNQVAGQATYDLRLDGPLVLASLSGQIRTVDGRLIVPEQQIRVAPITATLSLAGGRANVEARGAVSSGGQLSVDGSVLLAAPFNADLGVELGAVGLSDGAIYDTTVSGRITMRGPLRSGAQIAADLTLGQTELRITEAGPAIPEVLDDLKHVNEPAAVRRTRARAGLLEQGGEGGGGGRSIYPIDILVRAPSRIFVRGRGLDAELGGELRLGGTTRDVVPRGQFDLIRGRLEILGKRLTLSEGYARLQGGFDPYLYLVATARTTDVEIRIVLEGLASAPEITFESNPGLPEDEIVARLLFGRDLTEISPLQAVQLAAAVQTLTGGGTGLLDKLRRNFGLDDLDIRTGEDGQTEATVGKYITDNIYTDLTVGSDGESEVNLNIQISPSVTGRGSVSSDGNTSLGIFFERDY